MTDSYQEARSQYNMKVAKLLAQDPDLEDVVIASQYRVLRENFFAQFPNSSLPDLREENHQPTNDGFIEKVSSFFLLLLNQLSSLFFYCLNGVVSIILWLWNGVVSFFRFIFNFFKKIGQFFKNLFSFDTNTPQQNASPLPHPTEMTNNFNGVLNGTNSSATANKTLQEQLEELKDEVKFLKNAVGVLAKHIKKQ